MIWRVQISGGTRDLEALSAALSDDDLRVYVDRGEYVLQSEKFEGCTNSEEVLTIAQPLALILGGILYLRLGSTTSLEIQHVFFENPDGSRHIFVHLTDTVRATSTMTATAILLNGEAVPQNSNPIYDRLKLAEKDTNVAKVLRLLRIDPESWMGIYKIIEVIADDMHGLPGIVAAGWATQGRLDLLKHTANTAGDLASHGSTNKPPPKNPMDLSEARTLTRTISQQWLKAKLASQPE